MTSEQNKTIVRRFWKAFEADDRDTLNDLLAADLVVQTPGAPAAQNREMHLQGIAAFNAAFSDREFTIDQLTADGNLIATRTTMRGIHTGEWQGQSPTGNPFESSGLTVERVENGKIVERWFSFDTTRAMQQLGLNVPPLNNPSTDE